MSLSFNSEIQKWLSVMSAKNANFFVIAGTSIKIKLPIYRNVNLFEGGVGGGRNFFLFCVSSLTSTSPLSDIKSIAV